MSTCENFKNPPLSVCVCKKIKPTDQDEIAVQAVSPKRGAGARVGVGMLRGRGIPLLGN